MISITRYLFGGSEDVERDILMLYKDGNLIAHSDPMNVYQTSRTLISLATVLQMTLCRNSTMKIEDVKGKYAETLSALSNIQPQYQLREFIAKLELVENKPLEITPPVKKVRKKKNESTGNK